MAREKTAKMIFMIFLFIAVLPLSVLGTETAFLHPEIKPLDKYGAVADDASRISPEKTCTPCHDTEYIKKHSSHFKDRLNPGCTVCHMKGSEAKGDLRKLNSLIQAPDDDNCAYCHGIVSRCVTPLNIPEDYTKRLDYYKDGKNYSMSQRTGEIYASQNISMSGFNIKDKSGVNYPWDIHARRDLVCIDCHFTANDPRNCGNIESSLDHLIRDPRRIKPTYKYLKWPDHRLVTSDCMRCHDPYAAHDFLPYKERHFDSLSCQSCHAPSMYGPAFQSVDRTVAGKSGEPVIEFRGGGSNLDPDFKINTMYLSAHTPPLLTQKIRSANNSGSSQGMEEKISAFNITTYWFWKDAATGKEIDHEIIKKLFLDKNGYRKEILNIFDLNKDGNISKKELRLDTGEKKEAVISGLVRSGVTKPVISGTIEPYEIFHGLSHKKEAVRNCYDCHSSRSPRFGKDIILSGYAPDNIQPEIKSGSPVDLNGEISVDQDGTIILKRNTDLKDKYVLGHDRMTWLNNTGFFIFLMSLAGIGAHAFFRFVYFRGTKPEHSDKKETRKVRMYGFYERLWHWTMAAGIILLAITGVEIHYGSSIPVLGLEKAVSIHNVLAFIITINGFLSLFYHVVTGEIRQFFGINRLFFEEATLQLLYYIEGIFTGRPHPLPKTRERKLNPLQQITYVALLNILLPFQIITGIYMWLSGYFPSVTGLSGMDMIGPLHNFGSWMIITFIAVHVYLTTTGHSVFSNIKAMITGMDEIEAYDRDKVMNKYQDLTLKNYLKNIIRQLSRKLKSGGIS